jgi:hypothetical protein
VNPEDSKKALQLMVSRGCKRIMKDQIQDKEISAAPSVTD